MNKTKQLFYIFIFFSLLLSFSNYFIKNAFFKNSYVQIALDNALKKTKGKEIEFNKNIQNNTKNILYSIRDFKFLDEYINGDIKSKSVIEELFLTYSNYNNSIMQIRFLDKKGIEKIKIQRKNFDSKPTIASKSELQRKTPRYYFKESKKRELEKVWFSEIDLKMKNCKPIKPFIPSLRGILPIKNNGEFAGILVLDYNINGFLKRFKITPFYDVVLSNDKGYTLFHFDKTKAWGEYQEKKYSLEDEFPNKYKQILFNDSYKSDDFISKKLNVEIKSGLTIILKLKESHLNIINKEERKKDLTIFFITFIFSVILSFLIIKIFRKNILTIDDLKELNYKLKYKDETISKYVLYTRTNEKGNITDVSDAFCKLSGYTKDELIGKPHSQVRHPETKKIVFKDMWRDLKIGKEWSGEIKNQRKDGSSYWIFTNISAEYDVQGKIIGYISIKQDITTKKEFELHQKIMVDQSKLAALGEMIGNIAHQWRQPLSVISTIATSINLKKELKINVNDDDLINDMNIVNGQAQYLSETIETFRCFIKSEKAIKKIVLQDNIQQSIDVVKASLSSKNIEIKLDINSVENLQVNLVAGELSQVLINIFNNAKDALVENKIKYPWIKVSLSKNNKYSLLYIEDNAGGVPENILEKIFEPYFTTKSSSKGTGLGLYMSYRIVHESLDGILSVENSENGAKFLIQLPLCN